VLESILTEIDAEIARLQKARTILSAVDVQAKRKPGRPKNAVSVEPSKSIKVKRTLNAEARERIKQGQLKRWAAAKKSTGAKSTIELAKKSNKTRKKAG